MILRRLLANLQGSLATSESKWSVSVRQLISGENAADILALQEAWIFRLKRQRKHKGLFKRRRAFLLLNMLGI